MSVKTLDSGCDIRLRLGWRSDNQLGYDGPIKSLQDMPFSARCRRSARKSNNNPSRGHVGLVLRTGTEHANMELARP